MSSPSSTTTVGAPPGTLVEHLDADAPTLRLIAYGPESFSETPLELDGLNVRPAPSERAPVVWLDVVGTGSPAVISMVGERYDLHPLALEDVNNGGQRPKSEDYEGNLFLVLRMIIPDEDELETEQLSLFLGPDFVVTFQERPGDCLEPLRERIRTGRGRIRSRGADYLAYAILDAVIDHVVPVVEDYGDELEGLERLVLAGAKAHTLERLMDLRHELHALRRMALGLRGLVERLSAREQVLVTEDTRTYLRDCHDHALRLLESIDSWREFGSNLMELHFALAGQQLNAVMKVLTIISTIFIPLSFIAGLYGMNFERTSSPLNMPELGWYYGYPAAIVLMLVVVAGQLAYFHRRGWLSVGDDQPPS